MDQNFADPVRRQNPVLPCTTMYGGANAILERTGNSPPTPQSKSDSIANMKIQIAATSKPLIGWGWNLVVVFFPSI